MVVEEFPVTVAAVDATAVDAERVDVAPVVDRAEVDDATLPLARDVEVDTLADTAVVEVEALCAR